VSSGVEALRESWVAAMAGVPLVEQARKSAALRDALEFWR
jgi:ribulose-bisphosphate carboxylase large chain